MCEIEALVPKGEIAALIQPTADPVTPAVA
jgi:hypothetical protein